ncbi:hypothetical protein LP52_21265 [Streptomonospora alba]|uniref:Uncharacterized protein n=1 Tax=Streptomonospora alba TaxID=183763 RepID=A0A0C2FD69_9ACTN|nr:hypothetical protein [Streptomonospora alba]KIH97099.1 hypothetical protein LP52_21265 [Streptomonospora alba]
MSLPTTVVVVVAGEVVLIGAFAGRARRDGADKAAYHVLFPATAVVLGVILALAHLAGWW